MTQELILIFSPESQRFNYKDNPVEDLLSTK